MGEFGGDNLIVQWGWLAFTLRGAMHALVASVGGVPPEI